MLSINDNDNVMINMSGDKLNPVDLCEAEKYLYLNKLSDGGIIETVTQKLTVTKTDPGSTEKITILNVLGYIE